MRTGLILLLCSSLLRVSAQLCNGSHRIMVRTPDQVHTNGVLHYTIGPLLQHDHTQLDTVRGDPFMLVLTTRTGCGLPEVDHAVRNLRTGQTMLINVFNLPGDLPSTTLLFDFTPGIRTYFDLRRLAACMAYAQVSGTDTIACHGGIGVVRKHDAPGHATFEPLDLVPWQMPPNIQPYQAARPPGHAGGEKGLTTMIRNRFDRALVERLGITTTITGTALVETDNTVHEVHLNGGGHPALEAELVRTLQLLRGWQCAVAERPTHERRPRYFQAVRAPVAFSYTVSPDSIWCTIPAGTMKLSPTTPTFRDSIAITLHWIGGSCGIYEGSARIGPGKHTDPFTNLLVHFDGPLGDICTDIARQSFTIRSGPLPPGRYRIRMDVPPGSTAPFVGLSAYHVREFEVR